MTTRRKRKRINGGYLNRAVTLHGKGTPTVNAAGRPVQEDTVLLVTRGELYGPPRGNEGFGDSPEVSTIVHRLRIRFTSSLTLSDIESATVDTIKYNVVAAQEDTNYRRGGYAILHLESIAA